MSGWIKLHRQIKSHWVFSDAKYLKWWITVLIEVNHKPQKVLIKGVLIDCTTGQSLRSLQSWAEEFGCTKKTVSHFFKLLQKDAMVLIENLKITTRLTVCNYESYQNTVNGHYPGEETDTTPVSKRTLPTNKNDKNDKNDKEEKKGRFTPPGITDVLEYCKQRNNSVNAQKFIDFYESKGWMVGKNKMKDWKAAVRTWEGSDSGSRSENKKMQSNEYNEKISVPLLMGGEK